MGWGIGIAIGWPNASAGISYVKKLIKTFKARVSSYPNSIFEAEGCLDATLAELNAIGLLKQASLVITPNAYNEGVLYDVVPNTTLGDMDVVRATTATRVNESGLIEVVPRNLLTYSNDFSNGSWFPYNSSIIPNNYVSPNGNLIASKIVESNSLAQHALIKSSTIAMDQPITFSAYLKTNGRNQSQIAIFDSVYTNSFSTLFDLQNGTVISSATSGTGIILNSTITSAGDGWYRCSVTGSISSVTSINQVIYLVKDFDSFYLGDGVSGILVYGAQLEQGSIVTEYFPTTTRLNIPRLDYSNGSCPSLLVEPQRTNLLIYSEQFDSGFWGKNNASIVSDFSTSPNGTMTADKLIPSAIPSVSKFIFQVPNVSNGFNHNITIYAKIAEYNKIRIADGNNGNGAWFNLSNGTIGTVSSGVVAEIISMENSWYKCSINLISTTNNIFFLINASNSENIEVGDGVSGIYIWGAQLEQGSYATSYIPTVATSVTRNADVISKTGISSLIGQTEGVIYFENIVNFKNVSSSITLQSIGNNTNSDFIAIYILNNAIYADIQIANSYGGALYLGSLSLNNLGDIYKLAIQYNSSGIKVYKNGILVDTVTTVISNYNKLFFVNPFGDSYINNKSTILFNQYLTNAECIALTTI